SNENVLMPGFLRARLGSRAFGVSGSFVQYGLVSTLPILLDLAPRCARPCKSNSQEPRHENVFDPALSDSRKWCGRGLGCERSGLRVRFDTSSFVPQGAAY